MRNYINADGRTVAIDGEYECELGWCHNRIQTLKKWYFKKNSKYAAEIRLCCNSTDIYPDFWKFYLQFIRNGKVEEQSRIRHEAYDVLARGNPKTEYTGIEFITLEKFTPIK